MRRIEQASQVRRHLFYIQRDHRLGGVQDNRLPRIAQRRLQQRTIVILGPFAQMKEGSGTNFREFVIMYHEIGDEIFNIRRPPRESQDDTEVDCLLTDPVLGSPLPMRDEGGPDNCGYNTEDYRPGSRALNYRSEPFYRRLELQTVRGLQDATTLDAAESLIYGSYMNGS